MADTYFAKIKQGISRIQAEIEDLSANVDAYRVYTLDLEQRLETNDLSLPYVSEADDDDDDNDDIMRKATTDPELDERVARILREQGYTKQSKEEQ